MPEIWGMVATPFTSGAAEVDHQGLDRLVRHLIAQGCTTLGLFGPIAEAETLTPDEQTAVVRTVRSSADGTPLVIAVSASSVLRDDMREEDWRHHTGGAPVTLLLPSVHRTGRAVAADATRWRDLTGIPVALEDRPGTDRTVLAPEELVAAVRGGEIVAVKAESVPTLERIRLLVAHTQATVLAGNGGLLALDELLAGAHGLVAGITDARGIARLAAAWSIGDERGAARIHRRLAARIAFEAHGPGSVGIRKEIWRRQGIIDSAATRRPDAGWTGDLDPHLALHARLQ